jgi:polyhydroxyalkanoate synthesis regulator phasin
MEDDYRKYLEEKFSVMYKTQDEIQEVLKSLVKTMEITKDDFKELKNKHEKDISDLSKMVNATAISADTNLRGCIKNSQGEIKDVKYKLKLTQYIGAGILVALIFIFIDETREFIINSILGFLGLPHS